MAEAGLPLELMDLPVDAICAIAGHLDLKSLVAFSSCCSTLHEILLVDDYHEEGTRASCGSKAACSRLWGKLFYERYNVELPLGPIYSDAMDQLETQLKGGEDVDVSSEMTSDAHLEGLDVDWREVEGLEEFENEGESGFVENLSNFLNGRATRPAAGYCSLNSICSLWYVSAAQIIPNFWQLWNCGLITSSGQARTHTHYHPPAVESFRSLSKTQEEMDDEEERRKYKIYRVPCWKKLVVATHSSERVRRGLFSFASTSEISVAPEALCSPIVLRSRTPTANSAALAKSPVPIDPDTLTPVTGEGEHAAVTEIVLRHTMRLGPAAVVQITPMADIAQWRAYNRIDRDRLRRVLDDCRITGFCEITISLRDDSTSVPVLMIGSMGDFFVGVGTFRNG
eukprot:CAMPEP_0114616538 /NCGR_PEP_ID=MMETSP0168-20121206/6737_1 /TAXON_ID=95228 ORGANISM="Vannella sp., Strain DIVA3 517/6/12" /NCGR_SAMPLE_ID=MMETSP0168 /ASSEMBLY_ACC=CAM_ASM_000044 /LENGTH=396 /DNA_ID=CAMNT_0001827653 /DNA_START=225 /DNA_END=1415 /DNA_ORIENTATION=-